MEHKNDQSTVEMVHDFNLAFELFDHINYTPKMPPPKAQLLRLQALVEEVGELGEAIGNEDFVGILDALTDLQYFLDGTYIAFGMAHLKGPAFAEVHRTNMAKLHDGRPVRNAAGRVQKPEGWKPPDLQRVIDEGERPHGGTGCGHEDCETCV